jgi:pterin-4a-carbinolamine dehydratase
VKLIKNPCNILADQHPLGTSLAAAVVVTASMIFLLTNGGTSQADDSPVKASENGIMKVTEIEGISEYRLENGVRVLLFPDPSKEVVTVNMTVFVGSRHEGYGEAGMAHLLEHMLFKGTPDHPNVPKALQDRGARFNGTTWVDRTNYYETMPASDENLRFGLELEADRLMNSFIKGEDLEPFISQISNRWKVIDGHHIQAIYLFQDFIQALDFTNEVGKLAEEEGHHPDIHLSWGRVEVLIWTHAIDGLSENDFILAAKIDKLI